MFVVKDQNSNRLKYVAPIKCRVIDNRDPQTRGRIRVDNPLLGPSEWIPYLQTGYLFDIPEIGDLVFVQADGGYETHTIAWGKNQTNQAETVSMPANFQRTIPTNRGIYSPGGHLIEIDDGEVLAPLQPATTNIGIRFTTSNGSKITISEDPGTNQSIVLSRNEGQSLVIDSINDTITLSTLATQSITMGASEGIVLNDGTKDTIEMKTGVITATNAAGATFSLTEEGNYLLTDTPGNTITTDTNGISITDFIGNNITTDSSGINATTSSGEVLSLGSGEASIADSTGASLKISAGKITLGGASAEVLDLFDKTLEQLDKILTAIQALTVPTSTGPSSVPINSTDFVLAQTQVNSIKSLLGTIKG